MSLQTPYTNEQMLRLLALAHRHSNANLLDNWYFADPINQRGQTEYTATSGTVVYFIDRWRVRNASYTITLEEDGIRITNNSSANTLYVEQYLEVPTLSQDTCLSLFVAEVTGAAYIQAAFTDGTYGPTNGKLEAGLKTIAHTAGKQVKRILIQVNKGGSLKIKSAKLEYGSEQTLAHQDDTGAWVLNDPLPNKQQELAKCQRYLRGIKAGTVIAVGYIYGANTFAGRVVAGSSPMRANPKLLNRSTGEEIKTLRAIYQGAGTTTSNPLTVTGIYADDSGLTIAGTVANEATAPQYLQTVVISLPDDVSGLFSADL